MTERGVSERGSNPGVTERGSNFGGFFAFDSSRQSLVYPGPDGTPRFMHLRELVEFWEPRGSMEVELRKALPRFGQPAIQVASSLAGLRK
jgi:hypothetical protein